MIGNYRDATGPLPEAAFDNDLPEHGPRKLNLGPVGQAGQDEIMRRIAGSKKDKATKAKAKPTKRLAPIPFDTPKNQRAIATYTRVLSHAFHTLGHSIANQLRTRAVGKAFNPDQPRDERGRWTSGGGGLVVYHATVEGYLGSIREKGLVLNPPSRTWPDEPYYEGARGESVYVSGTEESAKEWAKESWGHAANEATDVSAVRAVVLRIEIPHDAAHLLQTDSVTGSPNDKTFSRTIPPSWIKAYAIGAGEDSQSLKWTEFSKFGKGASTSFAVVIIHDDSVGKADKTPEEILAEAMAIVEALDLSTLQVIVEDLTNAGIDVATDAGILAIAQFGMEDNASLVDHVNTRAVDFAKDRAAELIGMRYNSTGKLVPSANAEMRIDDSTRDMVRESIVAGLQNGDRITEIADDLADLYAFSDERAALIANTEVRRAQSQGALEGYKETEKLGVEMFKIWLVADEPCEICEPNGEEGAIPLDDEFDSGDDAPPAHPSCRCVLAPVVDPDAFEPEINPEEDMGYRA